jgi:glycosyltransferase involved in cell wall biosynthesis
MADKPKISIITASKNGGRFLRQSLDSIIGQTFTDYEHVIADSASTDDTLDILHEYKNNGYNIRWISEPDRGVDEGFYKAMEMARGQYIIFICTSDGYLDPDWFKKCVEVLDNDPEVSMVYGHGKPIKENGAFMESPRMDFVKRPPPSKEEFFIFWLGTFSLCYEETWCVRADVFRKCFPKPKYEPNGYFLQNHSVYAFNYNFNTNGYLPLFLPVYACYGREHHDSCSIKRRSVLDRMKRQYKSAIIKYGNELFSGHCKHVFRDGKSNIIRELRSDELDACRKKVLHYRINSRFYKCKKDLGVIHYWRTKIKILILYFLSGKRIYD